MVMAFIRGELVADWSLLDTLRDPQRTLNELESLATKEKLQWDQVKSWAAHLQLYVCVFLQGFGGTVGEKGWWGWGGLHNLFIT